MTENEYFAARPPTCVCGSTTKWNPGNKAYKCQEDSEETPLNKKAGKPCGAWWAKLARAADLDEASPTVCDSVRLDDSGTVKAKTKVSLK